MPWAVRAAARVLAASRNVLFVTITIFAALVAALRVDGWLKTICAGASTRSSPTAKSVRVPVVPGAVKLTVFDPSDSVLSVDATVIGLAGSVRSYTRTVVEVKPVTLAAVRAGEVIASAFCSAR